MKAITLWQPWATLVALGAKRYETRSWYTSYRGPIAIHAAKHWHTNLALMCYQEPFFRVLDGAGCKFPARLSTPKGGSFLPHLGLPFGAIVAVGRLAKVIETDFLRGQLGGQEVAFGDFGPDRYAWCLSDVQKLDEPVSINGCQGLWDVPADILARLPGPVPARP